MRPVHWVGGTRRELKAFPRPVRRKVGHALWFAQCGSKHDAAKALRGFGDAGVLEVVDDYEGNTYRAAYTVRFEDAIYVLHVFQKKAKSGIATPAPDVALIRARLKRVEVAHRKKGER